MLEPPPRSAAVEHRCHPPRPRRALRPAIIAATAALAVGVASVASAVAAGHAATRRATDPARAATASSAPAAVDVTSSPDPQGDPDAQGDIATPNEETTGGATPTSSPTGTGAVGEPAATASAPPTPQPAGDAALEAAVLTLVNQARARAGCAALTADPRLTAAARAHSADMARRHYFAHGTPEGATVGARLIQAGYRFSVAGENIAKGQRSPTTVMRRWLNSPGHRANILNCGFRDIGIGLARQGPVPLWTQDFGAPPG